MRLMCRFYKNQFPDIEDLVMVNVNEIEEMGVYVNLLEYNNRQGMILLTELSRRRIRSINKLIRVGRNEVVVVVRVDSEKGYIDLSKRRVSPEDIIRCEEKFARGKTVHSILRHTAEVLELKTNEEFEELYEKTAWFYDEKYQRLGAAYDIFHRAVNNEHELDDCPIEDKVKTILINNIRRRLTPQAVKCRADIEVACYGYEGVDAVKAALREGYNATTEEMPVKINLIAPPLYVITTICSDHDEGLKVLGNVIEKIRIEIEKYRGIFKIKMKPKIVTAIDDAALNEAMLRAEIENVERSGDDSVDSDSNEDGDISGRLSDEDVDQSNTIKELKITNQSNSDDDDED